MLDYIIANGVVLTMSGKGVGIIPDGAVGIKGNTIMCVGNTLEIIKEYRSDNTIDAKGKIVMPGFINSHSHSNYGVMCRGILTDLDLFLEQGLAGYTDTLTHEMEVASTRAHLLEGIRRGTTTFADMTQHANKLVAIHDKLGVRARIAEMTREMPWEYSSVLGGDYEFDRKYAQSSLDSTIDLLEAYGADPNERISTMVGFQALDYVTEELVIYIRELAKKHNAMIHVHMSQSVYEMEQVQKRYGARPVEVFEKLGLLNSNTLAAHMLYNTPQENKIAAESGMKMAYSPYSFVQVGDGKVTPPAAQYMFYGGTVGIGGDEPAYQGVNPFSDMKCAHVNCNVDAYHHQLPKVPVGKILRMHTIDAAIALGIDKQVGSLEIGKKADLIIIDTNRINMSPVLLSPMINVPQNIVSSAIGDEVETVIVDGKIIMENSIIKTYEESAAIADVQRYGEEAAVMAHKYYMKLPESEVLNRQKELKGVKEEISPKG